MMLLPKKSMLQVVILVVSCVMLPVGHCQIVEAEMPTELVECAQLLSNKSGDSNLLHDTSEEIYINCLQQILWKTENVQWNAYDITEKEKGFVDSLIRSFVRHGRSKRFSGTGTGGYSQTGFRMRREYRMISDKERFALHSAFNQMKKTGQYDIFAKMHKGIVLSSAHLGPNFMGWHRIYLILVEEALRRIRPGISIPYWDSTLDYDMVNPVDSIIWTKAFLGNGNGIVKTGPFANWMAAGGQLTRNIGRGSTLFSKEKVRTILTRCRTRDITYPTAKTKYNLEYYHGGPHIWVGGHMAGMVTSVYDPLFFLHHAYVDYIWELFRIRQATFCGVNPSTDYPPTAGPHGKKRPMDIFTRYRNIDGYRDDWTRYWYRYEREPTCSTWKPFCGSPYLHCDLKRQRCVSRAQPAFKAKASEALARRQEAQVAVGARFIAPPPEPRTQDGRIAKSAGRKRRAASRLVEKNDGAFLGGVIGVHRDLTESGVTKGSAIPVSDAAQLLPTPDYHETSLNDMLKPPIRNTFIINGHADVSQWAFIPVKVIYTSDRGNPVSTFLQNKRQDPNDFTNHSSNNTQYTVPAARECIQDESGAMQVRIQSNGLNYNGDFSDYALIDTHLPVDSATTYIGIKSPEIEHTEVILSAVHSCGLMCQAHCYVPDSVPSYRPCSGVVKLSNKDPNVYGRTYEEAVSRVWQGTAFGGGEKKENLRVVFDCSNNDKFPWLSNKSS